MSKMPESVRGSAQLTKSEVSMRGSVEEKDIGTALNALSTIADSRMGRIKELAADKAHLQQRIAELEAALRIYEEQANWIGNIFCGNYGAGWRLAEEALKREVSA